MVGLGLLLVLGWARAVEGGGSSAVPSRGWGRGTREERLTFSEEGFSPSSKWSQPMPWSFVEHVVETDQFLLIHHSYGKEPFYIPKHALSLSDRERLVTLFEVHLNASTQRLQLRVPAT